MTEKPRRLGRGLDALIANATSPVAVSATETAVANGPTSALRSLPIASIHPNPFQPRREFIPEELAELESSIRASGLLQPVTVRERPHGGYELVAGERRLRAASRLDWTEIPAIVRPLDDREMLTLALIENLQRSDLNPLDEALGYQRLMGEFRLTQQQVADAVGKDRSTVANLLRILNLPDGIKRLLHDRQISLGHARALLAFSSERAMLDAAKSIIDQHLTVRDVERLAQGLAQPPRQRQADQQSSAAGSSERIKPGSATRSPHDPEIRRLTDLLRRHLQTDVRIAIEGHDRGELVVKFYSADDLQRLLELVLGRSPDHT